MLEVGGQGAVDRARCPPVGVGAHILDRSVAAGALDARAKLGTDLAEHRLDGEDHALAQLESAPPFPVVVDLRILMHPPPDSMSDEVADDVEPACLRVLLHRRSDVAEMTSG